MTGVATYTEQDARRQGEKVKQRSGCFKTPGSSRGWDTAGERETPVALQVAPARLQPFPLHST